MVTKKILTKSKKTVKFSKKNNKNLAKKSFKSSKKQVGKGLGEYVAMVAPSAAAYVAGAPTVVQVCAAFGGLLLKNEISRRCIYDPSNYGGFSKEELIRINNSDPADLTEGVWEALQKARKDGWI